MKLRNILYLILFWSLAALPSAQGQDNRTVETRVADVLTLLPAKDAAEADRLFRDLINLPDEGLDAIVSRVVPNGKPDGVAPRYAVSLLTHHASTVEQKARIEKAYLRGLESSKDPEVGSYLIENIERIGTDASVAPLASHIKTRELADQAIGALVAIGTPQAHQALLSALQSDASVETRARLIQALGEAKHSGSVSEISKYVADGNTVVRQHALWALARIADPSSYAALLKAAQSVGFKNDPAEATHALVEYIYQLSQNGNSSLAAKASKTLLSNAETIDQHHFRLAALSTLARTTPGDANKVLLKEINRFDAEYRGEVLKIASPLLTQASARKQWLKLYKKSPSAELLHALASTDRSQTFASAFLKPALESRDPHLRMAAAEELAYGESKDVQPALIRYLLRGESDEEVNAARTALLRVSDQNTAAVLSSHLGGAQPHVQAAIIGILAERRVTESFSSVLEQTHSSHSNVRKAAYAALPRLAVAKHTNELLDLLTRAEQGEETKLVQQALIESMDSNSHAAINAAYAQNKARLLPLLPYVNDADALGKVTEAFQSGSDEERAAAFQALINWQDHQAVRTLLAIRRDASQKEYHGQAFQALVSQIGRSSWPDEQKLLMYDAAMQEAATNEEKTSVIRGVGGLRSFLALVFVSRYLDDEALNRVAGRSVMQIALPTADGRPGLTGAFVRKTLQRILDKLEGQDSPYERIDIQTYLADMPFSRGYEPMFNGRDLTGWQGLVENPIARAKLSKQELARRQKAADAKMSQNWSVKDGIIWFSGKGDNLCTVRKYGDFEMYVDWKISRDGDSGIYLRGTPQVQIWDPWGKLEDARVGSGGLYNNQKNPDKPLVLADNPVGEWNTFHIKMVGERVTVHLNGVKVVDNVVLENYWDRNLPIFPEEAIELQAHGNEIAFRNIFIRELGSKPSELTPEEKAEGFELLFNGKDLDNWVGNKVEYVVEDNSIAIYPQGKGHGNLFTEKEYSDFVFRFEFQLTPGANNGLGIHAPLTGDAAYEGKELQILDDTAPVYAKLKPWQYHGSVYGIVAAKRGFLRPLGEWNEQEVYVKGDHIKITLNGTVIVDADIKKAARNGTADGREHPGLNRNKGHIGFLGHGTVVRFRNIRIKEL